MNWTDWMYSLYNIFKKGKNNFQAIFRKRTINLPATEDRQASARKNDSTIYIFTALKNLKQFSKTT